MDRVVVGGGGGDSPLLGWTCGGSTTGAVKLGRMNVGHEHAGALYPPKLLP